MAGHHKARPWFHFFICHKSEKSNERRWIIWRVLRKKYAARLLAASSRQQNVVISQIVNYQLRKRCPRDLHVKDLVVALCYSWIDNFAHISHLIALPTQGKWRFCDFFASCQLLDTFNCRGLKLNRINGERSKPWEALNIVHCHRRRTPGKLCQNKEIRQSPFSSAFTFAATLSSCLHLLARDYPTKFYLVQGQCDVRTNTERKSDENQCTTSEQGSWSSVW